MSEEFLKTAELVKALHLDPNTQLTLYGLYKQATQGDSLGEPPTDPIPLAKYKSWQQHSGKSSEQAQEEYIALVSSFSGEGWKMGVSRPVFEEEEEDEILTEPEKLIKSFFESIKHDQLDLDTLHRIGVNSKDKNGLTSLHHAVDEGLSDMVKKLIDEGADVNLQDSEGMTPAHYAVELNNKEIYEILIGTGKVDLGLQDSDGNSVSDVIRNNWRS